MLPRVLLYTLTLLTLCYGDFVRPPVDVVYRHGSVSTGYVLCEVTLPESTVLWTVQADGAAGPQVIYSNPSFIGDHANSDKYSISSTADTSGNYTLVINDLSRQDSGKYTCQVGSASRTADVTVADPPGVPTIAAPQGVLVENTTALFTCASTGGFPAPDFAWKLGGRQLPSSSYTQNSEAGTSELTVSLKNMDHRSSLTCMASNLLTTTNGSLTLNVQFSPRVRVEPTDLTVMRNSPFDLSCNISLNPAYTRIAWLDGSGSVISTSDAELRVAGGVSDDTQYRCQVTNAHGMGEGSTQVTVHYAPVVTIAGGELMTADELSDVTALCEIDAKPAASVRWMKGETVVSRTSELRLPSISRQQAGVYRCVATNTPRPTSGPTEQMSNELSLTIAVNYAPEAPTFETTPSHNSGEYRAGERMELTCTMTEPGNPPATVKWYRESSSTPIDSSGDASLVITSPQVTDTDNYWCQAANEVSSQSSQVRPINFIEKPMLDSSTDTRKVVNVSLGSIDYQVQCAYKGFPEPTIQWFKNGVLVSIGSEYSITEDVRDDNSPYKIVTSTLKFTGAGREDGIVIADLAKYSCLASNSAGESEDNYEIQINVIFAPTFEGFHKVAGDLRSDVVIPCEVLSYPSVSDVTFSRDGNPIEQSDKHQLSPIEYNVDGSVYRQRRELTIKSVTNADYGGYSCVALNAKGTGNMNIALINTSLPNPPTLFNAMNVSWDSLVLTWQPGFDGGHSMSYRIDQKFESQETKYDGISTTRYKVTGLKPATEYTFHIYAVTQLGRSIAYREQIVTTSRLDIPQTRLTFDEEAGSVRLSLNSTQFCTKLQGSSDGETFIDISDCTARETQDISVSKHPYPFYRAVTCIPNRPDVCTQSSNIKGGSISKADNMTAIIVGVVIGVIILTLAICVPIIVCVCKKKRREQKLLANSSKTGHINPIMGPSGVPGKVQFSTYNGDNINSDLELEDEMDGLHYGEVKQHKAASPPPQDEYQHENYVYASVQKKPSELNKLNTASEYKPNHLPINGHMNIHDPSSISDNSDLEGYNEQPPSPLYRPPDDLSFLGDGVMAFHRYPSMTGSGYSTPDSKQLKKVVYEVIV